MEAIRYIPEEVTQNYLRPIPTAEELEESGVIDLEAKIVEREEVPKPLSFNLTAERDRALAALRSGDATKIKLAQDGFVSHVGYWSKEYLADIKTTHYYWEIVVHEGKTRLFHPQFGYAHEMDANAINDPNIPDYERKRRLIERQVREEQLEPALATMQDGETFMWLSPPPEGKLNDVYGGYSMGHLYEVKQVGEKKILAGRDVKNRLSNSAQAELLEHFAGVPLLSKLPKSEEILEIIVKPEFGVSTYDIEYQIKEKERAEGVVFSDDTAREQIIDRVLKEHTDMLRELFMQLGEEEIDEEELSSRFESITKEIFKEFIEEQNEEKQDMSQGSFENEEDDYGGGVIVDIDAMFAERIGGGSCGAGFGFDGGGGMEQAYMEAFGYVPQYVSSSFGGGSYEYGRKRAEDDPTLCRCKGQFPHFHCPGEKKMKDGKKEKCKKAIIVGRGIVKCPDCGEGKKC